MTMFLIGIFNSCSAYQIALIPCIFVFCISIICFVEFLCALDITVAVVPKRQMKISLSEKWDFDQLINVDASFECKLRSIIKQYIR